MTEYIVRYENEYLQLLPDKMQELVRCKDCKHCDEIDMYGYIQCDKAETHEPDWFCADGERRETDG